MVYWVEKLLFFTDSSLKVISAINEKTASLDTIYIRAGKYGSISSSLVTELLTYGKDISPYVPKEILEYLLEEQENIKKSSV